MKYTLFILFIAFALISNAQEVVVEYPYNPDIDTDEQIGVTDLMGILSGFGEDFEPEGIMVNSVELTAFLMEMQATILTLQAEVTALQGEVDSLEAGLVPGLANYVTVDADADQVVFSGANVHINNGLSSSYSTNGLGNLIIDSTDDDRPTVVVTRVVFVAKVVEHFVVVAADNHVFLSSVHIRATTIYVSIKGFIFLTAINTIAIVGSSRAMHQVVVAAKDD